MNQEERCHLLAEQATLRQLVDETPEDNVLDRRSLEARLDEVDSCLQVEEPDAREPARARITFRGKPVVGSHGVFAKFGLKATQAFADAVTMLAAGMSMPLAGVGPIPGRDQNELLITRTAAGSFGFELEEYREQPLLLDDDSAIALALEQTQELLEGTIGTDDELTEAVAGIDPRAMTALRDFLETVAKGEAVCTVQYRRRRVSFRDVQQVKRGAERLVQENVHEEEQTFEGEFQGVLPKRRAFEFRRTDEDVVITGRIGPDIENPDKLNRHLHEKTRITLIATRLGRGRPKYVLKAEPKWDQESGSKDGKPKV
jgi:hypothetical protein